MKNIFVRLSFLLLGAVLVFGCGPEEKPEEIIPEEVEEFKLELKTVDADFIELAVTSQAEEIEFAYVIKTEKQSLLTGAVIFVSGTSVKVKNGDVLKITDELVENKNYYLYAVAKLDEKNYSDIIELDFMTKAYNFSELVTVVDTYLDGFKVHITVPQSAKDKGNVIRYTTTSLAVYNVNKNGYGDASEAILEAQSVVSNGDPWGKYAKNDSTIVVNAMNEIIYDENGDPVLDVNGETVDNHNPITPGEPTVFLAGECRYGTFDEMEKYLGYSYGIKGSAYVVPLIDTLAKKWTGAFQKKEFFAKQPTLSDATVDIRIPEDSITVTDAKVYFDMQEGVYRYFYMILDDATYNQMLSLYLDDNEEWFQWFLTSYLAFYEWGVGYRNESIVVNAMDSFYEPLTGGGKYHVVCTVMGDEAGATQRYIHKEFRTREKTKRAPVIEVTPVDTGDPFEATFNIKAPNKDVVGAYWACNTAREFQLQFNSGSSYETLVKGNYSMTDQEIYALNSDKGLTWTFPTLDGEVTRLAIYGFNDEYTFNLISEDKATEGAGWADYSAPMAPVDAPIASPYFESLCGDWTATATAMINEELKDGSVVSRKITYSSKVTIGNTAPVLPETLDESVYEIYGTTTRKDVDGMFDELKLLTDRFTEYRLEGQNRLLCNGFIDYDYYTGISRLSYFTPFDLFIASDYTSYDVPQLIYDFGPKWFLEVQKDGSLMVPFDSQYLPPMHAWPGYPFYVGGVGEGTDGSIVSFYDPTETLKGFPVEVSPDNNTITIKPIELRDSTDKAYNYYMNALGFSGQSGYVEIVARVVSDIVLTRGWNETKSAPCSYDAAPVKLKAGTIDGRPAKELPEKKVFKSMTDFSNVESVRPARKYEKDEKPNVVTLDMVNKTTQKILRHEIL